ncbi:MAG: AAA family ATPase [Lachnospiraceae bacterium]
MRHIVVSVGCEYGSGGPAVGKILADDLGIEYYDRDLIDKIIERTGVSQHLMDMADAGIDVKGVSKGSKSVGGPSKYTNLTDRMVYIQTQVVKKLAERSSCVIIGRCADYILKDRKDCLNIFIYAPTEVRIKNVCEVKGCTEEAAKKLIEENDRMNHARYKQMTGTFRGDRNNRHLLIDSSLLGIEGTAKYIETLVALTEKG